MLLKEKIIEGALQQFLKHGIREMTMQKLVECLGLSTKTVYKYFTDKEDLLKHCLIVHYAGLAEKLSGLEKDSPNPVAAISRLWHEAINLDFGVTHLFYHDLNYYYPQIQDAALKKIFKNNPLIIKRLIEKGIKQKYFSEQIEPDIIIETMEILYTAITRTGRFKKLGLAPEIIMQNTIDLYLRGLCTAKGLNELKFKN